MAFAGAILLLLPACALLSAADHPLAKEEEPSFLLAWGNDGGVPALALLEGLPEARKEAVVLLPGSFSDGASLRVALRNLGVERIDTLFMPTGSPFPRGAGALLRELTLRRLVIAEDARSRTDWKGVSDKALELGAVQERLQPANGRIWQVRIGQWSLTYQKLPDSEIRGTLRHDGKEGCHIFESRVTGEFAILAIDAEGNAREVHCQPRTNRSGSIRITLHH